jgi:hypothetical protein
MTLINQLKQYRRANVELVGNRLAATDIEDTITLKPVGRDHVALHSVKPNGAPKDCILPQELFSKRGLMDRLDEALKHYVKMLRPPVFE